MGQYHHPVCIEAEEGLSPHTMGVGLKEGEQGFSTPSTPNAMVALVCARGGNMPADCSQSPIIGKWAGKRVLVVGDYAEDNDIPGWKGPRLSKLYSALTPDEDRKPKRDWGASRSSRTSAGRLEISSKPSATSATSSRNRNALMAAPAR